MHKENSPLYNLGSLRDDLDSSHVISRAPSLVPPLIKTQVPPLHDISNANRFLSTVMVWSKSNGNDFLARWWALPLLVLTLLAQNIPWIWPLILVRYQAKKILVSYLDKENQFVLAAVGSQPRQEQ